MKPIVFEDTKIEWFQKYLAKRKIGKSWMSLQSYLRWLDEDSGIEKVNKALWAAATIKDYNSK